MGYKEDLAAAVKRQNDLIVQQVLLQIISIVAECETYDEFRKSMYSIALGYLKDMEKIGVSKEHVDQMTTALDKQFSATSTDSDVDEQMSDDMFYI